MIYLIFANGWKFITNDFFWASKGKGSWCNNKRLRVSKRELFQDCVVGTGFSHSKAKQKNFFKEKELVLKNSTGIRGMGSAAIDLAYVASGKLDGFWETGINLWDVSTGILLVKEAGGKISKIDGNTWEINSRDLVASNNKIHNELLEKLTLL